MFFEYLFYYNILEKGQNMNKSDFFYHLPEELIAQHPIEPRDHSRMMVLSKLNNTIEHKHFYDVLDYFKAGDCLILNNTRVLPARIYGVKKDTGANVEFLLLNQIENDLWETLAGPGKRAKEGAQFTFGDGILECVVEKVLERKAVCVVLSHNHPKGNALPSQADIETTVRLCSALSHINIRLLDHVVLCDDDYVSMAQSEQFQYIFK